MTTRLCITAAPLLERWSVTSADNKGRSAWPPSPDTLFSALVASAASLGNACHPALYWLEGLGNPAIETDLDPPRVDGVETFDPVADRTIWAPKNRQPRQHNSIGHPGPVTWSWPVEGTEHLAALQQIAQNVTYIGSSRGPVLASAAIEDRPLDQNALVPTEGRGSRRLRGIYPGRLDELEEAFQRGERPRPTLEVGYVRLGEVPIVRRWSTMIPLKRVTGQPLSITHTVPLAEAIRQALTRYVPDGGPGVLTGHAADGAQLTADHLAIVPMPFVGNDHADGRLFGAALVLPEGMSDEDYNTLMQALAGWLSAGGVVQVGPVRWTMEIAHGDRPYSLRESRYQGESQTWSTITPVVFDRHPRRNVSLYDVVADMCRDVGLPQPIEVAATPHGQLPGTTISRSYSLGGRTYLRNRYTTHLKLKWSQPVPGPLLIGRGQYFGLGVLIPERQAA